MANYGYGNLDVAVTDERIFELLKECNEKHFNGMLNIENFHVEDGLYFTVFAGNVRVFECWLSNDKTLEYQHGHGSSVGWWIDGFMSSYVVDHIGGNITDDGHDCVVKPDFYKRFPTYKDYLEMKKSHMTNWLQWYRMIFDLDKHDYTKEFLKHIKGG